VDQSVRESGLIGRCERTYLIRVSPIRPLFSGATKTPTVAWRGAEQSFLFFHPVRLASSPLVGIPYLPPRLSELQVIEAHYGLRQVFLMMTR
jgi:hypothetical protein